MDFSSSLILSNSPIFAFGFFIHFSIMSTNCFSQIDMVVSNNKSLLYSNLTSIFSAFSKKCTAKSNFEVLFGITSKSKVKSLSLIELIILF